MAGSYDVVVLAGGTSRRFRDAGATADKLTLASHGRTLLETVVTGVADVTPGRVVVVGPRPVGADGWPHAERLTWAREQPPGGGPVAAVAAAVGLLAAPAVALVAADAPYAPRALQALADALAAAQRERAAAPGSGQMDGVDAAVLVDREGRRSTLCAVWDRERLTLRLADLGSPHGLAVRTLYDRAAVVEVADEWHAAEDVDTPADADRLGWS